MPRPTARNILQVRHRASEGRQSSRAIALDEGLERFSKRCRFLCHFDIMASSGGCENLGIRRVQAPANRAWASFPFINARPDEDDPRDIVLGALQKDGAAVLFDAIKIQDLTPDCPKGLKDMPLSGCNLRPDTK